MTIRYADVRPAKAQWHLDTCASTHITGRRDQFIGDLRPTKRKIECANGEFMMAKGIGDIKIDSIHGSQLRSTVIKGVLYAPKASENLISVGKLEKKQGIELTSSNGRQTLRKDSQVIMTGRTVRNLWQVVHLTKYYLPRHNQTSMKSQLRRKSVLWLQRRRDKSLPSFGTLGLATQESIWRHVSMLWL
jgi:hypothetical protein